MRAKGLNRLLGLFNLKLLKTTDVFDWSGETYHLPLRPWSSSEWMQDAKNNIVPIKFTNEEDRNFVIRAVNRALANPNLRAKGGLHKHIVSNNEVTVCQCFDSEGNMHQSTGKVCNECEFRKAN